MSLLDPPSATLSAFSRANQFAGWSVISNHPLITTGAATVQSQTSRIEVVPPFAVSAIAVVYENRYKSGYGETPFYNPIAVKASFQVRGATVDEDSSTASSLPFTIGGYERAVIQAGSRARSDALFASLAAGQRGFIKTHVAATPYASPAAPTVAISAGLGLGAGTYTCGITIVYPDGMETPCSATATATTSGGNLQVTYTSPLAASFPGACGWRAWAALRAATTPLYDTGSGIIPFGINFVYTRDPSSNLNGVQRVLAASTPSFPWGGGVNGGTGATGSNNGEYVLNGLDYTGDARAATAGGTTGTAYGPSVVLGLDPSKVHPSLAIVGDSKATGTADYGYGTNIGGFLQRVAHDQTTNRAYNPATVPVMGCVTVSTGGETASAFSGPGGSRRSEIAKYCTTIACNYGINDLGAGASAALIISYLNIIAARFTGAGRQFRQTTIDPQTGSTDGYASIANQTISSALQEGYRRQLNAWILSTGALAAVTGEAPLTAMAGAITPSTNLYAGGNGVATTFVTRLPFVQGSEVIRIGGITSTAFTYAGAATINGVAYASGIIMTTAPENLAAISMDYMPMPSLTAMLGTNAAAIDTAVAVEVNSAGVAATNGGWWKPGSEAAMVTGTSSGSNSTTTLNDTSKAWALGAYRGYSVRILTDTITPSAVGQQLVIGGNSATQLNFIVGGWPVTPSSAATYQIFDPYTIDGTHETTRGAMVKSAAASLALL